jgi:hypothetical protein
MASISVVWNAWRYSVKALPGPRLLVGYQTRAEQYDSAPEERRETIKDTVIEDFFPGMYRLREASNWFTRMRVVLFGWNAEPQSQGTEYSASRHHDRFFPSTLT